MPDGAPRICTWPGCGALVYDGSRCDAHPYKRTRSTRTKSYKYLYDKSAWRTGSKIFLRKYPLCEYCADAGRVTPATIVDHRIPHKGDERLFYDQSNWVPSCKPCHDSKTATQDGGFGNVKKSR